jgi:hypothetical protein
MGSIFSNTFGRKISAIIEKATAAGQMLFSNSSGDYEHTETTELVWDDTNKRLGIGVAAPQRKLTFDGSEVRTQQYLDTDYNTNL